MLSKTSEETRNSLECESELGVKNVLGITQKKDSAEDNLELAIMKETLLEDKGPNLKCSICYFQVKSFPCMENHVSEVHGLKMKLDVIEIRIGEKVPKPAKNSVTTATSQTLSQTDNLGIVINEPLIAKKQSVETAEVHGLNLKLGTDSSNTEAEPKVAKRPNITVEEPRLQGLEAASIYAKPKKEKFQCKTCEIFFNQKYIRRHSKKCPSYQRFVKNGTDCKICGKKFERRRDVNQHLGHHHKEELRVC